MRTDLKANGRRPVKADAMLRRQSPSTEQHTVQRPGGIPVMYQTWNWLVFLHWPISVEQLRPLIHHRLEIDTFDGTAWIAITPLTITGIRPPFIPRIPLVSSTYEINVRTYVSLNGEPGVWFFSLDASNAMAVWGARLGFSLPYFTAQMKFETRTETKRCHSQRSHGGRIAATFDAAWKLGDEIGRAVPGTLEYFLVERYCLFTRNREKLLRSPIHHRPWQLRSGHLVYLNSTMIQSHGLPAPVVSPLFHAQGEKLRVATWPAQRV